MRLKYYIQGILTLLFSLAILWFASGRDLPIKSSSTEIVNVEHINLAENTSPNKEEDAIYISGQGWNNDNELKIYVSDIDSTEIDGFKVETVDSDGNWNLRYPFNKQHFGPIITFKVVGQQSGVESSAVFNNANKSKERKSSLTSIFSI